jgi:hypothetical protein
MLPGNYEVELRQSANSYTTNMKINKKVGNELRHSFKFICHKYDSTERKMAGIYMIYIGAIINSSRENSKQH